MDDPVCPVNPRQLRVSITGMNLSSQKIDVPLGCCRSIDEYELQQRIGEGVSGTVYRARNKADGSIVAVKRMILFDPKEDNEEVSHAALREISILQSSSHENVVRVLDIACPSDDLYAIYMVMEYCEQVRGNASLFRIEVG